MIDAGYGTISGYMGGDNFCVIFEENDDIINIIREKISGIVNGYRGYDITRAYYGAYKTADKDITTGEMCDYAYGALEIAKQRPDKDICWYDEKQGLCRRYAVQWIMENLHFICSQSVYYRQVRLLVLRHL